MAHPQIPISKLAPSFITLLALCLGITSIRYAFDEKWITAASLILIAAVLDAVDGRLARMLDASSKFGAELDSLSDLVSFGVAPALVMYLWVLHEVPYKGVGWSVVLFFIACSAIRLARFNSNLIDEESTSKVKIKSMLFFTGIPMPAGGVLSMLPMLLTFELLDDFFSYWFVAIYMVFIGFLMVSKIPTFSIKAIHVPKEYVSTVLVLAAAIITGMILEPWITLPIFTLIYLGSIPFSIMAYRKRSQ
jgi:CDP-diacylglycerol--serine O-phosphatidyltransferase